MAYGMTDRVTNGMPGRTSSAKVPAGVAPAGMASSTAVSSKQGRTKKK
jgi:hypothetical protein